MGSARSWILPAAAVIGTGALVAATGGAAAPAAAASLTALSTGTAAAASTAATAGSLLTTGNVALGATALSGLASSYGAWQQASAQKAAAQYDAQAADQNAAIAGRAAADAALRGQDEVGRQSIETAQLMSRQRVALAATGVDLASGSALDVTGDTAFLSALDRATIRANAERETYAARIGASNALGQARQSRAAAGSASPLLVGGSTFLSGATLVADRWRR